MQVHRAAEYPKRSATVTLPLRVACALTVARTTNMASTELEEQRIEPGLIALDQSAMEP